MRWKPIPRCPIDGIALYLDIACALPVHIPNLLLARDAPRAASIARKGKE